jgi:hypothetical protein
VTVAAVERREEEPERPGPRVTMAAVERREEEPELPVRVVADLPGSRK